MHEQRGAANTANLRRPSKSTRPLDVAVGTAEVRGSALSVDAGWEGPSRTLRDQPATALSCAELRLPLVLSLTDSTAGVTVLSSLQVSTLTPVSAKSSLRHAVAITTAPRHNVNASESVAVVIGYTAARDNGRRSGRARETYHPSGNGRQSSTPKIADSPQ